jgi:hypothetical protein
MHPQCVGGCSCVDTCLEGLATTGRRRLISILGVIISHSLAFEMIPYLTRYRDIASVAGLLLASFVICCVEMIDTCKLCLHLLSPDHVFADICPFTPNDATYSIPR